MKFSKRLIFIVLVILSIWYLKSTLFPNEEDQIRKILDSFIGHVEVDGRVEEEHLIISLDKGQEASKLFDSPFNVFIRIDEREKKRTFARKELAQQLIGLRKHVASLDLSYEDEQIQIGNNQATVVLLGQAIWRFRGEEDLYRERRKGKIKLEKIGGNWQIVYAENVEPFEWYSED